jgi:hypothetical protein
MEKKDEPEDDGTNNNNLKLNMVRLPYEEYKGKE